jgi:hypothetical protein
MAIDAMGSQMAPFGCMRDLLRGIARWAVLNGAGLTLLGRSKGPRQRPILKQVLVGHMKLKKEMFHGVGPLATFSSRIKLAYPLNR